MSEFQFVKSQRVIVPADRAGAEGVQGVVTVNVARLGREPHYEVQWPCCDQVGEKGDLKMLCADVSESELLKAQPPLTVSLDDVEQRLTQVRIEERDAMRPAMLKLEMQIARLEAAAKRRKASRSRKRR